LGEDAAQLPETKKVVDLIIDILDARVGYHGGAIAQLRARTSWSYGVANVSPAATEGTSSTSITGYQEPTWWRGDRSPRCPLAGGLA
jgi:hypothetical protein